MGGCCGENEKWSGGGGGRGCREIKIAREEEARRRGRAGLGCCEVRFGAGRCAQKMVGVDRVGRELIGYLEVWENHRSLALVRVEVCRY